MFEFWWDTKEVKSLQNLMKLFQQFQYFIMHLYYFPEK